MWAARLESVIEAETLSLTIPPETDSDAEFALLLAEPASPMPTTVSLPAESACTATDWASVMVELLIDAVVALVRIATAMAPAMALLAGDALGLRVNADEPLPLSGTAL